MSYLNYADEYYNYKIQWGKQVGSGHEEWLNAASNVHWRECNSAFQWCEEHSEIVVANALSNRQLNEKCALCPISGRPRLPNSVAGDESTVKRAQTEWIDAFEATLKMAVRDPNGQRILQKEIDAWLFYDACIWARGAALREYYRKAALPETFKPDAYLNEHRTNLSRRYPDGKWGLYCFEHKEIGHLNPVYPPDRYQQCFICLKPVPMTQERMQRKLAEKSRYNQSNSTSDLLVSEEFKQPRATRPAPKLLSSSDRQRYINLEKENYQSIITPVTTTKAVIESTNANKQAEMNDHTYYSAAQTRLKRTDPWERNSDTWITPK